MPTGCYNTPMNSLPLLQDDSAPASSLQPAQLPQPPYATLPESLRLKATQIDAVYVHVPFCATKCHYCDFYSIAGHLDQAAAYLDALEREFQLQVDFFGRPRPHTCFIGGGTPTLLSPAQLKRLLSLIAAHVDLSALNEYTVEANPNTFEPAKAGVLADAGVNRISFGAQSFHQAELRMLQRDHNPDSVATAFALARDAGIRNLNLDLIFGIPGQTLASWAESLERALALEPNHLSCYSLIYEPQTAMTARLRRGEFQKIDEETELAMFEHVYRRLSQAGYTRYETSNYARTGGECRHNLLYWKAGNWLGFGPSAGSHIAPLDPKAISPTGPGAWQWKNAGSLIHYLDALSPTRMQLPITQLEALSQKKWSAAAAVFWLRLSDGLNYREFQTRTGVDVAPALARLLAPYQGQGFAELSPTCARITERGVAVSDHILARVLAALET